MKIIRAKKTGSGPRKAGPVRTSQKVLTKASPARPETSGQVASGHPYARKRGKGRMY